MNLNIWRSPYLDFKSEDVKQWESWAGLEEPGGGRREATLVVVFLFLVHILSLRPEFLGISIAAIQ